jgi:diguanylate cyclase (GGDEF)-like protein
MIESVNAWRLHLLSDIVTELKNAQQYEHVFHIIIDRIKRLYRCQTCAIILIDLKTEYLHVENSTGLSLSFCKEFRKTMATGLIGKLLWTGDPILITESQIDNERAEEVKLEKSFGSCVALQISINQRARGYLYVDSVETEHFTEEDIPILQMFADIAGLALYKYHLQEKLKLLERIDPITGLGTYVSFIEKVNESFNVAKTFGESFAIVIFDIDNFKRIINTYGRETGDNLLKEIGDVINTRKRNVDVACRFGVDEFVILLRKTGLEKALEFAGDLRKYIDDNEFTDKLIDSSVSVGVSVFPVNGSNVEELMLTGKHALFEAQRVGRNKVVYYRSSWYAGEPVMFG